MMYGMTAGGSLGGKSKLRNYRRNIRGVRDCQAGSCLVCGKDGASGLPLKIAQKGKAASWSVSLCGECAAPVSPLGPVAQILLLQSRGIDVLAHVTRLGFAR
jgi:hypothetical protein